MPPPTHRLHATAIAWGDYAALLIGPPGSGKSDLALRCLSEGAVLIADDQVLLSSEGAALYAAPPPAIAGKLEVRGVGIATLPYQPRAEVRLVTVLQGADEEAERLPKPREANLFGHSIPELRLYPFELSAPAKLKLALSAVLGHTQLEGFLKHAPASNVA